MENQAQGGVSGPVDPGNNVTLDTLANELKLRFADKSVASVRLFVAGDINAPEGEGDSPVHAAVKAVKGLTAEILAVDSGGAEVQFSR